MTEIRTQFESVEDYQFPENSHSTCFICKKSVSNIGNHGPIKTVFRHLKIYEEVKLNTADDDLVDMVPFCEFCYDIFTKLSGYCADLEILQMKIQYFLNQLNDLTVVEIGKQNGATAEVNVNQARKQFKRKLVKKCTIKNQIGPVVILPQLEIEKIKSVNYQTTDADSNSVYLSEDGYGPSDDEMVDMTDSQDRTSSDEEYASEEKSGPPINKPIKKKKFRTGSSNPDGVGGHPSSSKKVYPCPDCSFNFKCKDSLVEHSPLYHPEKHFPKNTKPNNLTHPQYKMYLIHLLNTEVDHCGSYKTGFKCVYCPKIFRNKRRHAVRLHLIKEHQDDLLENFIQLQEDVSTDELPKIVKMPGQSSSTLNGHGDEKKYVLKQFCKIKKRMKPEHTCPVCEVRTTSLRKHEAQHHPEIFLLSKQLKETSSEQFKLYCTHLIHKLANTFSKFHEGPDKKLRYNCPHCPNSYTDLQGCRNHLVLGHSSLLLVEIEKLQRTMKPEDLNPIKSLKPKAKFYNKKTNEVVEISTVKCEICDIRLTQRGMAIHMRKNHPDEYLKADYCEVCSVCKQKFRYKWWYNYHRTCCHPNILFERWKAEMTTVDQFKRYCEYLIGNEVKDLGEVGTVNGKIRYKCTYCSNTFCDTKYSQTHLVLGHEDILGKKLVELQKSKTVEEIEQGIIIKREEFEDMFGEQDEVLETTEVFCGKSATKMEAGEIWEEDDNEMMDFMVDQDLNEVSLGNVDREIKVEESEMDDRAIVPD